MQTLIVIIILWESEDQREAVYGCANHHVARLSAHPPWKITLFQTENCVSLALCLCLSQWLFLVCIRFDVFESEVLSKLVT